MAVKNYTLKEAVEIIAEGKDLEAIADLGKRFPILSIKIARLTAKAEKEIIDLMQYMPEYLTIKKVNSAVKTVNEPKAETEDATEAENKPVEEETAKEVEEPEEKENKPVEPKKRGRKPKAKAKAVPVEEPKAEAEETANNYEGKKAVDLFKLCKSRGLKVTTKKSAKYYIDVLKKDDEAKAKAEAKKAEEAEDDEDEWDIEDEPKEVKKPKKSAFIEEDEDDDESWDI